MERLKIDSVDKKILLALMKNARMENKMIADIAGVSDRTVARRIKRLEEKGIIKGYRVEIDRVKGGLLGLSSISTTGTLIENDSSEWDSLASAMKDMFGAAGLVILFHIGLVIGRRYGERLKEIFESRNELLLGLSQMFEAKGWGKLLYDEIDFQKGYGRMVIERPPFKNREASNILRGIICGCLEVICEKKVSVKHSESTANTERFTFEMAE